MSATETMAHVDSVTGQFYIIIAEQGYAAPATPRQQAKVDTIRSLTETPPDDSWLTDPALDARYDKYMEHRKTATVVDHDGVHTWADRERIIDRRTQKAENKEDWKLMWQDVKDDFRRKFAGVGARAIAPFVEGARNIGLRIGDAIHDRLASWESQIRTSSELQAHYKRSVQAERNADPEGFKLAQALGDTAAQDVLRKQAPSAQRVTALGHTVLL